MSEKSNKGPKNPDTPKPTPKEVKADLGKVLDKMFGPKKGDGSNRS